MEVVGGNRPKLDHRFSVTDRRSKTEGPSQVVCENSVRSVSSPSPNQALPSFSPPSLSIGSNVCFLNPKP